MSIFALRSNGLASSAYKNLSRAQTISGPRQFVLKLSIILVGETI